VDTETTHQDEPKTSKTHNGTQIGRWASMKRSHKEDVVRVPEHLFHRGKLKLDEIVTLLQGKWLTTLRAIPHSFQANSCFVHSLVFDVFALSSLDTKSEFCDPDRVWSGSLEPFPFARKTSATGRRACPSSLLRTKCGTLRKSTTILVRILYHERVEVEALDEKLVHIALEGSYVAQGPCIQVLRTLDGGFLVVELSCSSLSSTVEADYSLVYQIGFCHDYHINLMHPQTSLEKSLLLPSGERVNTCPGYEDVVSALEGMVLQNCKSSRPTGILLHGKSGIGKTHIVSCLATRLDWKAHWVSISSILLKESTGTFESVLHELVPSPNLTKLIVVDELHLLKRGHDEMQDSEMNNHMQQMVIDTLVKLFGGLEEQVTVVAISRLLEQVPHELRREGFLEMSLEVLSPTVQQRRAIGCSILEECGVERELATCWADMLALESSGCVALDLQSICSSALTRILLKGQNLTWECIRDTARDLIPSHHTAVKLNFSDDHMVTAEQQLHARSFARFLGYESVKQRLLRNVVTPWRRKAVNAPETAFARAPTGIILYGPSGCGKTLAALCIAASISLPLIKVDAVDVLNQWVGESESVIRSFFARARASAPCILFLDEIDAIASNRSVDDGSDVMSRILSTLLNEIDGITHIQNVLVFACTNRIASVDPALLRSGRLEEHIELRLPTQLDAKQILGNSLGSTQFKDSVDLAKASQVLVSIGASGAFIEGVGREVSLRILKEPRKAGLPLMDLLQSVLNS